MGKPLLCTSVLLAYSLVAHAATQNPYLERLAEIRKVSTGVTDYDKVYADVDALFGEAVMYPSPEADAALVELAIERRIMTVIADLKRNPRQQTSFDAALGSGEFKKRLALLLKETDRGDGLANAVVTLRTEFKDKVDKLPNVAAALCVVHDEPLRDRINENSVSADTIDALFGYYYTAQNRMPLGIKSMPPELLVYVVSASASARELAWANDRYWKNPNVGRCYSEVAYDYGHFLNGTKKKVTSAGFNLPNILRHGGVCADQAYYAASVGKSLGVPATYVSGRGATFGHAWVGFLETSNRGGVRWNFSVGRYEDYVKVRGNVIDPQTREQISDAQVGLTAELVRVKEADRDLSIALTDAAAWLASDAPTPRAPADAEVAPRGRDVASQLALLRKAVELNPANDLAWQQMNVVAEAGEMTQAQKQEWSSALMKLCGETYPDYAFDRLVPLVATVRDANQRIAIWEGVYKLFDKRPDLQAGVRIEQGGCYEMLGDLEKAGQAYFDVVEKFANDGPFVLDALQQAEGVLVKMKRQNAIVPLYGKAWDRIQRPVAATPQVFAYGNWYRVGMILADKLDAAGRSNDAKRVRANIKSMQK